MGFRPVLFGAGFIAADPAAVVSGVVVSAGDARANFRADEVRQFAIGALNVVESFGDDVTPFLSRPEATAPDSTAGEWFRELPENRWSSSSLR